MPTPSSKAPYWLTLGFAAGLGFGWLVHRSEPQKTAVTARPQLSAKPEVRPVSQQDAGTLAGVEKTFWRWGGYAVWENNVTEIALWSVQTKRRSDFYEVRRSGGAFYFRTLVRLTRPLLDHGARSDEPVAFTETQAMHDDFHRQHSDYDPASEPVIDLPPRPPERFDPADGRIVDPHLNEPSATDLIPEAGG